MSDLFSQVLSCDNPFDLFGSVDSLDSLKKIYRNFAKLLHPDSSSNASSNQEAFIRLEELYALALSQLEKGIYGKVSSIATFSVGSKTFAFTDVLFSGSLTDRFYGLIDGTDTILVSVSKMPQYNSFVEKDKKALLQLRASSLLWDNHLLVPEDHFYSQDPNGYQRFTFYSPLPLGYVTLQEVMDAYPDGLHPKDMSWIYRRLLDVVGFSHSLNLIHTNITPANILVGLGDNHQIRLIDWYSSVPFGSPPFMIDSRYKDYYPLEITEKQNLSYQTDIYMMAYCMKQLMGNYATEYKPINAFLTSCLFKSPFSRPGDSWKIRQEFTALIDKMWGQRQYRPLILPN